MELEKWMKSEKLTNLIRAYVEASIEKERWKPASPGKCNPGFLFMIRSSSMLVAEVSSQQLRDKVLAHSLNGQSAMASLEATLEQSREEKRLVPVLLVDQQQGRAVVGEVVLPLEIANHG